MGYYRTFNLQVINYTSLDKYSEPLWKRIFKIYNVLFLFISFILETAGFLFIVFYQLVEHLLYSLVVPT